MTPSATSRPFPIPVVAALGPGSQDEDDTLDYLHMPSGMATYRPPALPEPEQLAGHARAVTALQAVLSALGEAVAGGAPPPVGLHGLGADDRALINQVLGEGEVSAQVLPDPHARQGQVQVQVQESVFAGVWRVLYTAADGQVRDTIEVAPVPRALLNAAADDAAATATATATTTAAAAVTVPPPGVFNVQPVLVELQDQRSRWCAGDAPHVVNLTLLPMTAADISYLDHVLGTGRVLILSRGYGNCRITNTTVANTWRLVYYNSQDHVILNAVEVSAVPDVACAAPEDLRDSHERLAEVLDWVARA
jgi:hydrogenase-1 operon protein HyaF